MSILITPAELSELLAAEAPVTVLDVRWRLDRPDGLPEYLEGHIPGAVYVDLDHELAANGRPATEGRHPLPAVEDLQESARRWGIDAGDTVVVYDNLKNLSSSRAWWLLSYAGLADVRVLDGSLRGWTAAGLPLETGAVSPEPGSVELTYGALPVLDIAGASSFPGTGSLLDARAPERFNGDVEPIDPRAGHIPGALNTPTTGNVDENGRFLAPDALRERFESLGVKPDSPVATYCGSGVTAAHNALALTLAGFSPIVYPGSWSQWSNHPDRPVATTQAA